MAALVVTGALSWRGHPTSLTLALIAGFPGGGLGAGQAVAWTAIGWVLPLVALAPLLGVALGGLPTRGSRLWHVSPGGVRRWHLGSYAVLCLASGVNDAQKLLAVVVSVSPGAARVDAVWLQLVLCAGLFSIGTAVGLGRIERTVNRGFDSEITQTTTAAVMLASTGVGSPVGMAQTLSGSLVGEGRSDGSTPPRWPWPGC